MAGRIRSCENANLLDVDHRSFVMPFRTVEEWTIVATENLDEEDVDNWAIVEIGDLSAKGIAPLIEAALAPTRPKPPTLVRCPRCRKLRPKTDFERSPDGVCRPCWELRYDDAAITLFNLVRDDVVEVEGGFRMSLLVDLVPTDWLCDHVHETPLAARGCLTRNGCDHDWHGDDAIRQACIERRRALG